MWLRQPAASKPTDWIQPVCSTGLLSWRQPLVERLGGVLRSSVGAGVVLEQREEVAVGVDA